jgi:ABC-type antimicrobial peptide transport system permease subunit
MAMMNSMFDQIMYIIIGIILLALMFGIINTMLMAVLERQREFGVMMAIGMNKVRIFLMIVLETVLLTCAGIPLGIVFTIGAVEYFHKSGIDLSGFSKGLSQYGVGNIIYPEMQTNMLLPIIAMTAITAVLASLYPAKIALKYKPATAIHKM